MVAAKVLPERLETLLLARLAIAGKAPVTADVFTRLLRRYAPTTLTEAEWRALVEDALARLDARRLTGGERQAIRDELLRRVGAHTAKPWDAWIDRMFPALALGVRLDDAKALRRLSLANGWSAAIAARALDAWSDGPPPALAELCDRVVWRALGLPGPIEPCPPGIRTHFLQRYIAIQQASPAKLVRQIAARAVEAQSLELGSLRDALVRRWLTGRAPEPGQPSESAPAGPREAAPASLVDAVHRAAQGARDGVFGDRKVFISSVWQVLRAQPAWTALALDDFKAQLVAAHRDRQLVLARADLVAAMDPALVAASETQTDGATFHFIVREPHR